MCFFVVYSRVLFMIGLFSYADRSIHTPAMMVYTFMYVYLYDVTEKSYKLRNVCRISRADRRSKKRASRWKFP